MRSVDPGNDFASWKEVARRLLAEGVTPGEVIFEKERGLFLSEECLEVTGGGAAFKVPTAFVKLAEAVACNADESRWALLYRILWRIVKGGERELCEIISDADVAKANLMRKNVRREIHKMHAFVRFQLVSTDTETGREKYSAWFEPDHWIVKAGAPFFRKRFANMDWSIFTPKGCAHWNGKVLVFSEGLPVKPVTGGDELEAAWKIYYRSIFNPARLKVKMMQTEMPKKYWKNLPEAELIESLIRESASRVRTMHEKELRPVKAVPNNRYLASLREMDEE